MTVERLYGKDRLRSGLLYFMFGRGATGLLGVAILMMQVRLLSHASYGAYVALFALFELAVVASSVGLNWVGLRFVPDYRIHGGSALGGFLLRLCLLRLLTLVLGAAAWFLAMTPAMAFFGLAGFETAADLFGIILVTEGMLRFLIVAAFDSLLAQAQAQAAMLMRNLTYAGLLLLFILSPATSIQLADMVRWELTASIAGLASALVLLLNLLRKNTSAAATGWVAPGRAPMMRLGLHMYVSGLLSLLYGVQAFVLLATRLLGVEMAAVYGFCRNVGELVRKFLPAQLLASLIRPAVLARYAESGSFAQLNAQLNLIYLLSLSALLPVLVVFGVAGNDLAGLLSSGKYADSGWLLFAVLTVLIPFSHRILLELAVTALQRAALLPRATLVAALLALPLAAALAAWTSLGAYGLVLAGLAAEVLANLIVVRGLRAANFSYVVDWGRLSRLWAAGLVAILVLLPLLPQSSTPALVGAKVLSCLALTTILIWQLRIFSAADFGRIRRYLPWNK